MPTLIETRFRRALLGALLAAAYLNLPVILGALVWVGDMPFAVLVRTFLYHTAVPLLVAWGLARGPAGSTTIDDDGLSIRSSALEIDVPAASLASVSASWLPLPTPSFSFVLGSGRTLPYRLRPMDPMAFIDGCAAAGLDVAALRSHPAVRYGLVWPSWRPAAAIAKLAGVATIVSAIFFYTHQHIAYGGTWGQYYQEGMRAYAAGYAQYWITIAIYLCCYAGTLRLVGEGAVMTAAWSASREATLRSVRRGVEWVLAAAYWGGVPLLVAARYLA